MSKKEIDDYLAGLDEPKRSGLNGLRKTILDIIPDAEQCISYRMPAFKVGGKTIAGFAAFKDHLSYFPHSGSVLQELPELDGHPGTKSSLHFPVDKPLSKALVKKLIAARMRQALAAADSRSS
jgi:uncharacterized protein YdhG (YjbR/CyaY superfamily)